MMRILDRFFDLAEAAIAAGVPTSTMAAMQCIRPLQRMGEDIADRDVERFDALQAAIEREFATLVQPVKVPDAAHG
jgi:spore coat protein CotH